jgi:hypothetical protein
MESEQQIQRGEAEKNWPQIREAIVSLLLLSTALRMETLEIKT